MARRKPHTQAEKNAMVLAALTAGDRTAVEVCDITGLCPTASRAAIVQLRETSRIHVTRWQLAPGAMKASCVYRAGAGTDAPYPKVPPKKQKPRPKVVVEVRDVDDEDSNHGRPKVVLATARQTGKARRDFLVAALFGEYRSGVAA